MSWPMSREDLLTTPVGIGSRPGWEARKTLSPSQLGLGAGCRRAWALPYLLGLRSPWVAGAPVGLATHWLMEKYFTGHGIKAFNLRLTDWRLKHLSEEDTQLARDSARAIMPHTPQPSEDVIAEHPLILDTTQFLRDLDVTWEKKCAIDLIDVGVQIPTVYDYKTTGGNKKTGDRWCYVPTPDELMQDAQFNIYCASLWQAVSKATGYIGPILGKWIYVSKQRPVVARTVTAEWRPGNVWFYNLLGECREMLALKEHDPLKLDFRTLSLPVVPDDAGYRDIPCNSYGGCIYHARKGGPCGGL